MEGQHQLLTGKPALASEFHHIIEMKPEDVKFGDLNNLHVFGWLLDDDQKRKLTELTKQSLVGFNKRGEKASTGGGSSSSGHAAGKTKKKIVVDDDDVMDLFA